MPRHHRQPGRRPAATPTRLVTTWAGQLTKLPQHAPCRSDPRAWAATNTTITNTTSTRPYPKSPARVGLTTGKCRPCQQTCTPWKATRGRRWSTASLSRQGPYRHRITARGMRPTLMDGMTRVEELQTNRATNRPRASLTAPASITLTDRPDSCRGPCARRPGGVRYRRDVCSCWCFLFISIPPSYGLRFLSQKSSNEKSQLKRKRLHCGKEDEWAWKMRENLEGAPGEALESSNRVGLLQNQEKRKGLGAGIWRTMPKPRSLQIPTRRECSIHLGCDAATSYTGGRLSVWGCTPEPRCETPAPADLGNHDSGTAGAHGRKNYRNPGTGEGRWLGQSMSRRKNRRNGDGFIRDQGGLSGLPALCFQDRTH